LFDFFMKVVYHFTFTDDIVVTDDKRIFNVRTKRFLKKTVCGGSIGYWVNRCFYTYGYLLERKLKVEPYFIDKKESCMPF